MVQPIAPEVSGILAYLDKKPAIVLFTFNPETDDTHAEPVYNTETANPDDALIIRAHDLGPARNQELFRYYANKSPDRAVYRYDLSKHGTREALTYLGTSRELAK
jgi:hypothetical protein